MEILHPWQDLASVASKGINPLAGTLYIAEKTEIGYNQWLLSRPYCLVVRTLPSQGSSRGSNPLRAILKTIRP